MRLVAWLALASILVSVAAQFTLKAGMQQVHASGAEAFSAMAARVVTEPRIYAGFLLYGLGALLWLAVLGRWDVSKAYPLVGVGFIVTLAVGFLNGESVTMIRILGVMMISVGVALVARS